jgi:hypothetical protein
VDVRLAALAGAAALCLLAPAPPTAVAAEPLPGSTAPSPAPPEFFPPKPEGYEISSRVAIRIADQDPKVAEQAARYGQLTTAIQTTDDGAWQVGYKSGGNEVAQVKIDGVSGQVRESWTGYQVAWPMARGYSGQFGHVLNAPYVWIPLSLVFLLGLLDWRRPFRIAHLDLLVLLSFSVSHVFFNRGEIGLSVPLVYPALVYLLGRAVWVGFRGGEGLRPSAPANWLAIAAVLLVAFRITINVVDSGVIDVGYAGTIGADRITQGDTVWGENEFPEDNRFGDTYGPLNYYAYVPFELALPWDGEWDELPSAHAAAIFFDLAAVAGLILCARRLRPGRRGNQLAAAFAFAWLAYPYTDFTLQSNSNDSLIAALLAWSLALFARPAARGASLALAAAAKFAPLVLAPLYAAGERGLRPRGLRPVALFTAAFLAVGGLMLLLPTLDPGLETFYERTVKTQVDRTSPFSIWGQVDGIQWLQTTVFALTAVFAAALAFVPRRRSLVQVGALSAAALIALQLSVDHWFYLYIPWFLPGLFVGLSGERGG